jgi:hypothetical protein
MIDNQGRLAVSMTTDSDYISPSLIEYLQDKFTLFNSPGIASLMQNIALALITVIIPFAIAILLEILQKRKDSSTDFAQLDLLVILEKIFSFKKIIIYLLFLFLPSLLWDSVVIEVKYMLFLLWLYGIVLVLTILNDLYQWVKGNNIRFRLSYLMSVDKPQDKIFAWKIVWGNTIDSGDEIAYFSLFSKNISTLIDATEKYSNLLNLLDIFLSKLNLRSAQFVEEPDRLFEVILKWNYRLWSRYNIERESHVRPYWPDAHRIMLTTTEIIKTIEDRALNNSRSFLTYQFFDKLKEHLDACTELSYKKELYEPLCKHFFNIIKDAPTRYDVWHSYFPSEWKITIKNLKDSPMARLTFQVYEGWAVERIFSGTDKYDWNLEEVSRELFPDVDPIVWAPIIIFIYTPSFPDNSMRAAVEQRKSFGHMGRVHTWWGEEKDIEEISKKELQNTIDLAFWLYSGLFTKESLERYLFDLNNLDYAVDSSTYKNKRFYIKICSRMLTSLLMVPQKVREALCFGI